MNIGLGFNLNFLFFKLSSIIIDTILWGVGGLVGILAACNYI